jgi:hypothetical protein
MLKLRRPSLLEVVLYLIGAACILTGARLETPALEGLGITFIGLELLAGSRH